MEIGDGANNLFEHFERGSLGNKIPMHVSCRMNLMSLVRPLPPKEVVVDSDPRKVPARKPSVNDAINIAKSRRFLRMVDKFKKKFFAKSSEKSRLCKRAEVMKLAKQVAGDRQPLPLDKDTVEGVAAALKEAGLRSGQQYMTELKLMHVEAGFDVEPWLKRSLDLRKKSLERERGPVVRAAEVGLDKTRIDEPVPMGPRQKGAPVTAVQMFVWAALWMLREIEVRNMKAGHVRLCSSERSITIWLPISKCDQQGLGVR